MRKIFLAIVPSLAFGHPDPGTPPGKQADQPVITGNGNWAYEAVPHWGELPEGKSIGPTHGGVVIDAQSGLIYFSTDAAHAILVYRPDGSLVKSIAPECQGFHAMDIRAEEGRTVLYGAQLAGPKPGRVCKIDTEGRQLLEISQSTVGDLKGGWNGITGLAVAPDGSIFCSMGYGAQFIHKFDASGKHLKTFGGKGSGPQVLTASSHGLKIDTRYGEPRLLVCDRENRRIFHTTLEGEWIGEYATHLRRPCSVSILGDFCAVAELEARVTILDKNGTPAAFLGDNPDLGQWTKFATPLDQIKPGLFTAPHGLSFDVQGNLYVQDWNQTGRVTKLRKVKPMKP